MLSRFHWTLLGLFSMAYAAPAWAQLIPAPHGAKNLPDAPPAVSVSGQLFTEFRAPTGHTTVPLAFDVPRLWISPIVHFNDTWSAMTTISAVRGGQPATTNLGLMGSQLNVTAQMAFVTASNLLPGNKTAIGMLQTPWNEFEIEYSGFQMYAPNPLSRAGYVPGFDVGLRTWGTVGKAFYHAAVLNGEGNRAPEAAVSGGKAYEGILGYKSFLVPAVTVATLGHRNHSAAGPHDTLAVFAGYKVPGLTLAGYGAQSQVAGTMGRVTSGFGVLGLGWLGLPRAELIARADWFDPNLSNGGDSRLETIAGVQLHVAKHLTLGLTNQNTSPETGAGSNALVLTSGMFY